MAPPIFAHDVASSGPITQPSSPKPAPVRRSPTIMTQSSGRTSVSLTIKTKAHLPCPNPNCNAPSLGLQKLQFSRRNSIRNPVQCSSCNYIVMYLGGSPPPSRNPTFNFVAGTIQTEGYPRTRKRSPAQGLNHMPSISSSLAAGGLTASSIAFPSSAVSDPEGIQTQDFQAAPAANHIINHEHNLDEGANPSSGGATTINPERKKKLDSLGVALRKLLNRLRMKRFAIKKLKSKTHGPTPYMAKPVAQAPDATRSDLFEQSSPREHICECTGGCHCSEQHLKAEHIDFAGELLNQEDEHAKIVAHWTNRNGGRRSLDLSTSAPRRRRIDYVWDNFSQSLSDLSQHTFRRSRNRDSGASYPASLSFGDRSSSQIATRPQPPQNPHATAAGPSTAVQVGNVGGRPGSSLHDSVMQD